VNDDDGSSFLFSLTNMNVLKNTNKEKAIYRNQWYGPVFGDGYDLCIVDLSNKNDSCSANIGSAYKDNEQYPYDKLESWRKFTGGDKK
jgi:hypothetical protein